jgi:hypothetical protein
LDELMQLERLPYPYRPAIQRIWPRLDVSGPLSRDDVKHFIDVGRYSGAFSVHQHDQLKAASGIATGETTCSVSSFLQLLLPECW